MDGLKKFALAVLKIGCGISLAVLLLALAVWAIVAFAAAPSPGTTIAPSSSMLTGIGIGLFGAAIWLLLVWSYTER